MTFTKPQRNAIVFLIIIFTLVVAYHFFEKVFHPVESYDFSKFEAEFFAKKDSVEKLIQNDNPIYEEKENIGENAALNSKETFSAYNKPININRASLDELTYLPRIGPAIGQRIIDYRNENGPFIKKEDIQKVRGIGPKTYEGLKDLISVN
jgi:competence protein ComEA